MRFSNKQIFNGDSKDEIVLKVNENFSQIISFSSGPEGRPGIIGPTGYPGSAGPVGPTGASGTRASSWTLSPTQPSNANEYDQWIDQGVTGNGDIYQYEGSSWQSTGISLIESEFFQVKNDLPIFGAVTDFSGIYFSGTNQNNESLVISDANNTSSNINPNYAKLLVSTSDQTERPIFSFRKSSLSQLSQPSFYWSQSGNSSRVSFQSGSSLSLVAGSDGNFSPQSSGTVNFNSRNAYFNAYNTIDSQQLRFSASGNLIFNTTNYSLSASAITANVETYVFGSAYIEPALSVSNRSQGVVITRGGTSSFPAVSFSTTQFSSVIEYNFAPFRQVFNINQSTAILSETDPITDVAYRDVRSRATFGATGDDVGVYDIWSSGIPTSATGPFGYHVVGNTQFAPQVGSFYIGRPSSSTLRYYADLSSLSNYYNDSITFTLPSTWAGGNNVYVKIPSITSVPPAASTYPLYGPEYVSEYKVFLDYGRFTNVSRKITGIYWIQLGNASGSSTPTYTEKYVTFNRPCYFFELTYHYNNSSQVMAYVKTCTGQSYPIQMTNYTGRPVLSSPVGGGIRR